MPIVFMTDRISGACAMYEEPPGGGSYDNRNAPRNAPLLNPTAYMQYVYFHSSLDFLEVASETNVSITHPSANGASSSGDEAVETSKLVKFKSSTSTVTLVTHNLGVIPDVLVSVGGNTLWPGMPVQASSNGRARYAVVFVNTTQVRLYTWTSVNALNLPAITLTYKVTVFRPPPAPSGNLLFNADGPTKRVVMGRGKFDSDRRYLQIVSGGSPQGLVLGRPGDLANGAVRLYRPNGTSYEPVPDDLAGVLRLTGTFGNSMGYDGNYSAPSAIQVQAP